MDGLHVKIIENLKHGEKSNFDLASGLLTMQHAGSFTVSIEEYEREAKAITDKLAQGNKSADTINKQSNNEYQRIEQQRKTWATLSAAEQDELNQDIKRYSHNANAYKSQLSDIQKANAKLNDQLSALKTKYAGVRWIYQAVDKPFDLTKDDFNKSFGAGLTTSQVNFSELWQGGGLVYIEPYFYEPVTDPQNPRGAKVQMQPFGKPPYGCFIKGKGKPEVITAEWKDKQGNLITGEVAFGSTVYLHIYTSAMYGQLLDIKLQESTFFSGAKDVHLTDSGADGNSSGRLDPNADDTHFVRPVSVWDFRKEAQAPPAKAIVGSVIDTTDKKQDNTRYKRVTNVQKSMFPVFIERKWQYSGDNNNQSFNIHPIITVHNSTNGVVYDLSGIKLKVAEDGQMYAGELKGNSPVTVNELKLATKRDPRLLKDFTIGVFIDGTMNDYYNSEARYAWENDQIRKFGGDIKNPIDHLVVHAQNQKAVSENFDYKFGQTSYENALSNPAILFQYYVTDLKNEMHPVLKVYSEGMGTNTKADENGKVTKSDYKKDDLMEGPAFGLGEAGIITRVKRAIELMVQKIKENLKDKQVIGTLTVDVFGFSRGAAAARNFVHEITMQSYLPKLDEESSTAYDHNNNMVSGEYSKDGALLPPHGWLGYLLTEAGITFDNLVIRFAGLYDTVPHFGLIQSNDRQDLGLDNVMYANYTVHLVAGDEHRKNFSLVDISCITGKRGGGRAKKGIELYLPGVHCDVGGSYEEGRPEPNDPLNYSFSEDFIDKDLNWLIDNGWYTKDQVTKSFDGFQYFLKGNRNYLSNQYSFIPLHMMLDFAVKLEVGFKAAVLKSDYKFTQFAGNANYQGQWPDNVAFLNKIKKRLYDYANGIDGRFQLVPSPAFKQSPYMTSPEHARQAALDYDVKQVQGQAAIDKQTDIINADIKKLRNQYLHFNANKASLIGVNEPHFEGDNRKREITGAAK